MKKQTINPSEADVWAVFMYFTDNPIPTHREHHRYLVRYKDMDLPVKLVYEFLFHEDPNEFNTYQAQDVLRKIPGIEILDMQKVAV